MPTPSSNRSTSIAHMNTNPTLHVHMQTPPHTPTHSSMTSSTSASPLRTQHSSSNMATDKKNTRKKRRRRNHRVVVQNDDNNDNDNDNDNDKDNDDDDLASTMTAEYDALDDGNNSDIDHYVNADGDVRDSSSKHLSTQSTPMSMPMSSQVYRLIGTRSASVHTDSSNNDSGSNSNSNSNSNGNSSGTDQNPNHLRHQHHRRRPATVGDMMQRLNEYERVKSMLGSKNLACTALHCSKGTIDLYIACLKQASECGLNLDHIRHITIKELKKLIGDIRVTNRQQQGYHPNPNHSSPIHSHSNTQAQSSASSSSMISSTPCHSSVISSTNHQYEHTIIT
jgi:hypothetical protein